MGARPRLCSPCLVRKFPTLFDDGVFLEFLGSIVIVVLVFGTARFGAAEDSTARSVTLTVNCQPAQEVEGFGCSMVDLSRTKMPDSARAEMFDRVFGDLKMNVLRLWAGTDAPLMASQMLRNVQTAVGRWEWSTSPE